MAEKLLENPENLHEKMIAFVLLGHQADTFSVSSSYQALKEGNKKSASQWLAANPFRRWALGKNYQTSRTTAYNWHISKGENT